MGNICVWLCFFCGNDVHSREVWAEKNKFHRGDGDSYDNRTDYVVFHGAYSRLVERYRNRFRKKFAKMLLCSGGFRNRYIIFFANFVASKSKTKTH